MLPPALLSIVRKPIDYFAFNAWLPELPGYLFASDIELQRKLAFLPNLALFWFSADSPYGGVEWGSAVTVGDLLRILSLSILFGLFFALVLYCRDLVHATGLARGSFAEEARQGLWRACSACRPAPVR